MSTPAPATQPASAITSLPTPHPHSSAKPPTGSLFPPDALSSSHAHSLQRLIEHFNQPGYALPSNLKDLKLFWKDRPKLGSGSTSSPLAPPPSSSGSSAVSEAGSGASTPASGGLTSSPESERKDFTRGAAATETVTPSQATESTAGPKKKGSWLSTLTGGQLGSAASSEPLKLTTLEPFEKAFLTAEQFQRFLRAVRWDYDKAVYRAEETVVWRREFDVEGIVSGRVSVEEEAKTGKEMVLGYDVDGKSCLYMFPWKQNTKPSIRQIYFVIWCLERTIDLMPPGVEKLCLLIDFGANQPGGNSQPTSVSTGRTVLNILQTYYCERLGRAICVNPSTIFWAFFKLVQPFIDPVTKEKIRFSPTIQELTACVPAAQLEKASFGGDLDFRYNHDEYWPAINKLGDERRSARLQRWHELGENKCGMSEWDLRGGREEAAKAGAAVDVISEEVKGHDRLTSEGWVQTEVPSEFVKRKEPALEKVGETKVEEAKGGIGGGKWESEGEVKPEERAANANGHAKAVGQAEKDATVGPVQESATAAVSTI